MVKLCLGQRSVNVESFGGLAETLISCPQQSGRIEENGGQEMRIG
jgi:hypothetical protein